VDYGTYVTLRDIDATESVQRRFTKRLPGLYSVSYTDRRKRSGGTTMWQSSANALPAYCHALPVALPVF